jgi:hypothetical protein
MGKKYVMDPNMGKATQWKRGQSGNPNGRPRKVLSALAKKVGVDFNVSLSKQDKFAILESMLEMNVKQLKELSLDKTTPAFMVIVSNAIRADLAAGKMHTVNDLFDRFFGRPNVTTKTELDVSDTIKEHLEWRITSPGKVKDE